MVTSVEAVHQRFLFIKPWLLVAQGCAKCWVDTSHYLYNSTEVLAVHALLVGIIASHYQTEVLDYINWRSVQLATRHECGTKRLW